MSWVVLQSPLYTPWNQWNWNLTCSSMLSKKKDDLSRNLLFEIERDDQVPRVSRRVTE